MWSRERIVEDLRNLGVRTGDAILVHASLRSIGQVQGGADTVIGSILDATGPTGTLIAPAFNRENRVSTSDLAGASSDNRYSDSVCESQVGVLATRLSMRQDSMRSNHPILAFTAVGANATFLTENAPFHHPLGSAGPLAKVHQIGGSVLLIGVGHAASSIIHLAENWASVPYCNRRTTVMTRDGAVAEMEGDPGCSEGFVRIEPVLRQARILKCGSVGAAPAQLMRAQYVVSMAIQMLRECPVSLLCENSACESCITARKLAATQQPLYSVSREA